MADVRRLTLGEVVLLVAIVAVAASTRAGYLIICADYGRNDGPLRVEQSPYGIDELAVNLLEKQRFAIFWLDSGGEVDTAHVAPGYPLLMAGVGRLIGNTAALNAAMRWFHCGLGALTPALYFLFARRAFRNRMVASLAGVLGALHPFWIIDTASVADGVTATFLLALLLFLGVRAAQTSGPLSSLCYGLSLAALSLVRAALLPFAFVALAWFLLRCRMMGRGWLSALLAFLGFLNGLAPWAIRNWQTFEAPLPIVNSTYYHLWLGNKPPEPREPPKEQKSDWHSMPPVLEDYYANEILREIQEHPAETVHRRLLMSFHFVLGERWFTNHELAERIGSEEMLPTWLAWSYPLVLESTMLALVVLSLFGWRWTYAWRASSMPSSLALIWIPLPYILSHAEALSGPRLPLDGVLLCYAAFALACLLPGRGSLWAGESASGADT